MEDLFLAWDIGGGSFSSMYFGAFTRIVHVTAPDMFIKVQCPSLVADSIAHAIIVQVNNGGSGTCSFTNNATLF